MGAAAAILTTGDFVDVCLEDVFPVDHEEVEEHDLEGPCELPDFRKKGFSVEESEVPFLALVDVAELEAVDPTGPLAFTMHELFVREGSEPSYYMYTERQKKLITSSKRHTLTSNAFK